jgi:hypothetical protein
METRIDRSFPCLVFLAERLSKPSHDLSRTPESDYVFFSPSIGLKREKQSDALPKERTVSHSVGGPLSEGQSGGF